MDIMTNLFKILFILNILRFAAADGQCRSTPEPKMIKTSRGNYVLNQLKVFEGSPPTELRYFDGDIFYSVDSKPFVLRRDSLKPTPLDRNVTSDSRNTFVDDWGNKVMYNDGVTTILTSKGKKYKIVMEKKRRTGRMAVEMDKNIIFFIGYDDEQSKFGTLNIIDTKNLDVVAGRAYAEELKGVGDRISAISLDRTNGKIVLVILSGQTWSLNIMKNINVEKCKTSAPSMVNKKALEMAIKAAGEQIVNMYEDAVLGYEQPASSDRQEKPINETYTCTVPSDEMKNKLEQLQSRLKEVNEKYDNLYLMTFESKVIKEMKSLKLHDDVDNITALDPKATRDETKKYVLLLESDFNQYKSLYKGAVDLIKRTSKYFDVIHDNNDFNRDTSIETTTEFEVNLDKRFGEENLHK